MLHTEEESVALGYDYDSFYDWQRDRQVSATVDRTGCRAEDAYLQFFMEEAAEIAYEEAEAARGELAYCPDQMECYDCGRGSIAAAAAAGLNRRVVLPYPLAVGSLGLPYVMRTVIALGPIAEAHRDPTSTYKLTCSHYAM